MERVSRDEAEEGEGDDGGEGFLSSFEKCSESTADWLLFFPPRLRAEESIM